MREEKLFVRHIIDLIWDDIQDEDYDFDLLTEILNKELKRIFGTDEEEEG